MHVHRVEPRFMKMNPWLETRFYLGALLLGVWISHVYYLQMYMCIWRRLRVHEREPVTWRGAQSYLVYDLPV